MLNRRSFGFIVALLVSGSLGGSASAGTFTFSYDLNGYVNITASGVLTTGDYDPISGGYPIIGITGTRTISGISSFTSSITGLVPVGEFMDNSNLLYYPAGPCQPALDYYGLSFTIDDPEVSADSLGHINIYYHPDYQDYFEANQMVNGGTFVVSPGSGAPAVPEPATAVPLLGGLLGLGGLALNARRRASRAR